MDSDSSFQDAANQSQRDVNSTIIDGVSRIMQSGTEENKISEAVYITLVSIFRIIFVIGLFTNIVSLNALWKKAKKTSTEIFFIGITSSDLIFLASNTTLSILDLISDAGYIKFTDNPVNVIISGIMVSFLITNITSAFLMSLLSIERIFAVYRPLTFREMWTPKIGKIGLVIGITLVLIMTTLGFVFAGPGVISSISVLILMLFGAIVLVSNIITLTGLKKRVNFTRALNLSSTTAMERVRKQTHILLGISVFFLATIATTLISFATISTETALEVQDPHHKKNLGIFIVVNMNELTQMCFSTFNCVIFVALNDRYINSFGIRFLMEKFSSKNRQMIKTKTCG